MRIISGSARRTPLVAPKGKGTRPTADRVKENLFNILAPHIVGARFLDLFCGSGAIGIEALSRGAKEAVFVDSSIEAINVLNTNLARAKLSGHVLPMCALAAIATLGKEGYEFDIIFLDPPYGHVLWGQALEALVKNRIISPMGMVVAECETGEEIPLQEGTIALQDVRTYGGTKILFYS